jgi:hypothetical protein
MLTNLTNFHLKVEVFFIFKCGLVDFRQDAPNDTKKKTLIQKLSLKQFE